MSVSTAVRPALKAGSVFWLGNAACVVKSIGKQGLVCQFILGKHTFKLSLTEASKLR